MGQFPRKVRGEGQDAAKGTMVTGVGQGQEEGKMGLFLRGRYKILNKLTKSYSVIKKVMNNGNLFLKNFVLV
jgi:hypothetical protein